VLAGASWLHGVHLKLLRLLRPVLLLVAWQCGS
jgi:hypothetical protein